MFAGARGGVTKIVNVVELTVFALRFFIAYTFIAYTRS